MARIAKVPEVPEEYLYVGSTNTLDYSIVTKVSLKTYTEGVSLTLTDSAGIYLLSAVIDDDGEYLYVADDQVSKSIISKIKLSDFSLESTLQLGSGEAHVHDLIISGDYLYVGCGVSPAKIVKINLSTFTKDSTLTLPSGENNVKSLNVLSGYLYAVLGTLPCKISKITLSTFAEDSVLSLTSGQEEYGGRSTIYGGKLYVPTRYYHPPAPRINRVVKVDLASFTRDSALDISINDPAILSPVHNEFLYVGSLSHSALTGPIISKINLITFTEDATLTLTQANTVEYATLQWGMIIKGNYLYISLDQYSPASVDKVDLTTFTEVGLCQVWEDVDSIASALAV